MAVYEIRTLKSHRRPSLIAMLDCGSDLAAIVAARELLRKGEAVEVWRDATLVYRTAPRMEQRQS